MPMDSIPSELLRPIIEHLEYDHESLLAVSLASHLLRVEGQRILFRTMDFATNKESHMKFLTVIISSSLLAQHVEEFVQLELLNPDHQQEPLWELTCRGLNAMVNLKHLVFRALDGGPCAQILRGCTFHLEILHWGNYRDAEQLLEFLPTQTDLRILGVEWSSPELNTSDICPRLQALRGNQITMDAFLPGRTITSLKWLPDLEESRIDGPIYIPPQEFHHLRYFSFGGICGRPLLSVVLCHLPVLEVLELVGLHFVEELGWLAEIPTLRVFILTHPSPHGGRLLSLEEREAYFPQVFALCKSLQHIDINIEKQTYQRWFRDGSPSDIFDIGEVLLPDWKLEYFVGIQRR